MKVRKTRILNTLLSICLAILIIIAYQVIFADKFFPRTYIGHTNITFLTPTQAYRLLDSKSAAKLSAPLKLEFNNQILTFDLSQASINYQPSLQAAFDLGHQDSLAVNLHSQIQALFFKKTFTPKITLPLDNQFDKIAQKIDRPAVDATVWLDEENLIHIKDGENGVVLDKDQLKNLISNYLIYDITPDKLPTKNIEPAFSDYEAQKAKIALESIKRDPIKLVYQSQNWSIDLPTLYYLLNLEKKDKELLDKGRLTDYLVDLSKQIDQEISEALFNFDPRTGKVTSFKPSQVGRKLDIEKTSALINLAVDHQRAKIITLPVESTQPKIKTDDANDLGIKELIGQGVSHFALSIPNRIFNVELTASRLNGVLVSPGEVFSFNRTVGEISADTGFKQAYIIKSGRTILDDGGGVCQDSTTLFRAVLNAGLPIVKRTAHAYRVGYYEQGFPPGLDATVFAPSVDFQFKNDTPAHILIQAYTVGTTLYVDLYGTSDGRIANITKPAISNQTPPPPELRQDDLELPKGEVKQVDFAAWGAQVSFTRTVTRNGTTIIHETFRSNYKPWQAVYLVGTKE